MYTHDEKMQIANTIIQQLGGNRFRVMTGAKNFMALDGGVTFAIPGGGGFAKHGINKVNVVLDASDTYTITAFKIRRTRRTGSPSCHPRLITEAKGQHSGVYNDMLQSVFTDLTGLGTHL